jgi:hypothetical protein
MPEARSQNICPIHLIRAPAAAVVDRNIGGFTRSEAAAAAGATKLLRKKEE